jgi:tetratricopeptide (TPR) repeat protein
MAKKRIIKKGKGFGDSGQQVSEGLALIRHYLEHRQAEKAAAKLQELQTRYPDHPEVLALGLLLADKFDDSEKRLELAERLRKAAPDEPYSYMELAEAYLDNLYPFLALQVYQQALEKFADNSEGEEFQEAIEELEEIADEMLEELHLEREDIPIAILHEQSQIQITKQEYTQAIESIEQILSLADDFLPAYNNLALIYRFQEKLDSAIATLEKALEIQPDDVQSLANAVKYSVLSGQIDRSRAYQEKLQAIPNNSDSSIYWKKAEAFSILRDDRAMIELGELAEQEEDIFLEPIFWHWLAVAHANEGHIEKARQLWREVAEELSIAEDNLENIDQPSGEKNSPWAFKVDRWITDSLLEIFGKIGQDKNEKKKQELIEKLISDFPSSVARFSVLLDRGCPLTKAFFMGVAASTKIPAMLEALKEFALGDRGSDEERMEAAKVALESGFISSGMVRMYMKEQWKEILLLGMEINDKPSVTHSKKVSKMLTRAVYALREEEAIKAENLLKEALAIEPNSPDIQYNLVVAYDLQERQEEADELLQQIHQNYPDYAFASISIARRLTQNGNLEEAKTLLQTLLTRNHFHRQEFAQLCNAQIELAMSEKNKNVARSWFNMWKNADPDGASESPWSERLKQKSLIVE